MKKIISRELLLTTKAAQKWEKNFDENVETLLKLVSKIDTPQQRVRVTEIMDVYNKKHHPLKYEKRTSQKKDQRPFEFIVTCN